MLLINSTELELEADEDEALMIRVVDVPYFSGRCNPLVNCIGVPDANPRKFHPGISDEKPRPTRALFESLYKFFCRLDRRGTRNDQLEI